MMEIFWFVLSFLLMGVGLVGCFINRVPGPVMTFAGILVLYFCTDADAFDTTSLVLCGVAVVVCKVADLFVPKIAGLISDYGKSGKWGCVMGSLLGVLSLWPIVGDAEEASAVLLAMVVGLVVFPFLFAYFAESISRRSLSASFRPALAAFTAYLIGTFLKLAVTVYCIYTAFNSYGETAF